MRVFAFILITLSLVAGCIAAITAYVPELERAGGGILTLNAEAGRSAEDPGRPLISPRDQDDPILLTDTLVTRLAEAGVQRVRVREFSFGRWQHAWLFVVSCLGMLAGGLIIRRLDRRSLQARLAAEVHETETPEYAVRTVRAELQAIAASYPARTSDETFREEVTRRIDHVHATHLAAFIDARQELIARFGIAGFARVMDRFAAAERQVNRAWSAAADDEDEEMLRSLENGAALFSDVEERLRQERNTVS